MSRQQLRPSQIITTFGPGSIVDLPDDSVMLAGTDHWFDGQKRFKKIGEPRLQSALKVREFRTPPVGSFGDFHDGAYVRAATCSPISFRKTGRTRNWRRGVPAAGCRRIRPG